MSYASELRELMKTRCVHLCTKAATLPMPDGDEEPNPFDTAIFWCGFTTEALGPDGCAAEPGACDAVGRDCYEPPVRG